MGVNPTRVESPVPLIDFDKTWENALKRYEDECGIVLPEVLETATTADATLELIDQRAASFKEYEEAAEARGLHGYFKVVMELMRYYAMTAWFDQGLMPDAMLKCYAAMVYMFDVPRDSNNPEQYGTIMDFCGGLWKITIRTKHYIVGEIEAETRGALAEMLGEVLVTIGFATRMLKEGTLEQKKFTIIITDSDYFKVLDQLDMHILRDGKIKSTGLLLACKDSLAVLRDTILNPREDSDIRKAFFEPVSRQHRYLRDVGGNLKTGLLYRVARKESWDERKYGNIFAWLGAPNPCTTHKLLEAHHTPKTGEWFLKTDRVKEWKSEPNSTMLLNGPYGCGKTYLCYSVIENVLKECSDGSTVVAYFYFDIYEASKTTYHNLITGLLAQLTNHFEAKCATLLRKLYRNFDSGAEPPFTEDVLLTLKNMLHLFKTVYLVIDGAEESDEYGEVVGFLRTVKQWNWDGLHILLTAEKDPSDYPGLVPLITHHYPITKEETNEDILLHIEHKYKEPGLSKWKERGLEFLRDWLPRHADGNFQWVTCQLQSIQKARSSINAMRSFLCEMPKPLDDAYQYIFSTVHPTLEDDGLRLLPWLGFCRRPLNIREYATGVEFTVDQDPPLIDEDYRLGDVDDALDLFPKLLLKSPTYLYKMSHGSVRQYLLRNVVQVGKAKLAIFDADFSHAFIAKGCLAYLLQLQDDAIIKQGTIDKYPLAIYSAHHWFDHVSYGRTLGDPLIQKQMRLLFTPGSYPLKNWVRLYDIDKGPQQIPLQKPHEFIPNATYYAAHLGLHDIIKWLIEIGQDVNASTGIYGNPLQVASVNKHVEVVKILLEHGANVNAKGGFYQTALQAASFSGAKDIVQLLLDRGADVNAEGGYYGNALKAALKRHHSGVVQMLKDAGAAAL
ncbi:hypothetical protein AX15_007924 [Amanita polypyramis BW_CC]|nr:hypothetical protein AX15_007924 [Amanita polypyramis BW_CC]